MKLITFKPITFLLKQSASNITSKNKKEGFTVISINNKNLSLVEVVFVALKSQQKRIGFSFLKKITKNISQYILVGKDKSVVIMRKMLTPTVNMLPSHCG